MHPSFPIVFLSAALLSLCSTHAAPDTVEARVYKGKEGKELRYRISKPADYDPRKKYPLVLCLHGAGGRGNDNTSRGVQAFETLFSPTVQTDFPCFLMTPQCPQGSSWVEGLFDKKAKGSYSLAETPESIHMKMIMEVLESLQKEFPIDSSRLYITGQSMGGFGTWDMIQRHPEVFAAAVPICGAGDPSKAESIKNLPIWIFQGENDTMVPPQGSREMHAALKAAGSKTVTYTEYPKGGHGVWVPAWTKEKELIPWLFSQHK